MSDEEDVVSPPLTASSEEEFGTQKKIRRRRRFTELMRDHVCGHPSCGRHYASFHALQAHIKLKHLSREIDRLCTTGTRRRGRSKSLTSSSSSTIKIERNIGPAFPMAFPIGNFPQGFGRLNRTCLPMTMVGLQYPTSSQSLFGQPNQLRYLEGKRPQLYSEPLLPTIDSFKNNNIKHNNTFEDICLKSQFSSDIHSCNGELGNFMFANTNELDMLLNDINASNVLPVIETTDLNSFSSEEFNKTQQIHPQEDIGTLMLNKLKAMLKV